jgi:hypothetical protein
MSQLNNLTLYPKELEEEEQNKLKTTRKKKIIKIIAEINLKDKINREKFKN